MNQLYLNINNDVIKLKKRSGIFISSEYKDSSFYSLIRAKLVRKFKDFQTEEVSFGNFFLESEKGLVIPRFFPVKDYLPRFEMEDLSHVGKDIIINHNIVPRNETQKIAIDYMLNNDSGIIQLQPGEGKTIIAISIIATRKKKAFILVHKDYLVNQWIEGFLNFTDINPKEIMRLTSSTYLDALQCSVVVCTDQTFTSLLRRDRRPFLEALTKEEVGIFIADEVHTSVGSKIFSECSLHIPSRVIFGLSATPERGDGNSDIIEYHMGKVFKLEESNTMEVSITILGFDFEILNGTKIIKGVEVPINRFSYLTIGGKFQRSRYLNLFRGSKNLVDISKNLINKFKDRDILFMGERIEKFLQPLFDWCPDPDKGLFISGKGDEDLQKRIVFTTPGKCRDGINIPKKDCLIMSSPISNITQVIGRVNRTLKGKKTPIVIDMVDTGCPQISKTLFSRLEYYENKNWKVQFISLNNGKLEVINKSKMIELINKNDNI